MAIKNERLGNEFISREDAGLVRYEADWYSGSQIQVLIGDIVIDNAAAISYQVSANRIPLYGFGSEYFAFTAKSHTLISGHLTVAFKESGYLLRPVKRFHNLIQTQKQLLQEDPGNANFMISTLRDPRSESFLKKKGGFTSLAAASRAARKKKARYYNAEQSYDSDGNRMRSAGLVKQLGALSDSDFENRAEEYEDVVWYGSNVNSPRSREKLYAETVPDTHGEITDEEFLALRRLDQMPSVDITITYGDMEAPNTVNHTVQKLLDVQFTGEVKEIVVGGNPILETYSFIARNRV